MKKLNFVLFGTALTLGLLLFSGCKKDDDTPSSGITHTGDKWNITSVDWNVVDQNLSGGGQTTKSGTTANAGAFYLKSDGTGSYLYTVDAYKREGTFTYTVSGNSISITYIKQVIMPSFSQTMVSYSGDKTDPDMTLSGSETEQTSAKQFVLTCDFVLKKQ